MKMAGYDNIKDKGFDRMTVEQRRAMASKAGKASAAARKKRKKLKEIFQMVGSLGVTDDKLRSKIEAMGIPADEVTWNVAIAVSTIMSAIRKNDVKTVMLILELMDADEKKKEEKNAFSEFMKSVE